MHEHKCPNCGYNIFDDKDGLVFHAATGIVSHRGKQTKLTPTQMMILECLIDAGDKGITITQLYNEIYSDKPYCEQPEPKVINVFASLMRKKLRPLGVYVVVSGRRGAKYSLSLGA
jgi:DNA-binding response OmpR family regulator